MELQISHSASTEISQESDIRKAKKRYWKNTKDTMRLQACRDNRSTRDAQHLLPRLVLYDVRKLCEQKGITILEATACSDHIHMVIEIPPKYSVSSVMGYLKGKSSLMIFDRHANLKYRYGNRHFWCRGYYVDTVGRNEKAIREYVKNQLQEDIAADQISLQEYVDPFTGEPVKKNK